jgi:hypothetical protein
MRKIIERCILFLVLGVVLTGCAGLVNGNGISPLGVLIGSGTGVLVGHLTKSKELGAVAAIAGYGVGHTIDAKAAEARERERARAAYEVERARAEAIARGTTTCEKTEVRDRGRLVVDREKCKGKRVTGEYRGDPPPPTISPTVVYEPTTVTVDPYADPPAVETLTSPGRRFGKRVR